MKMYILVKEDVPADLVPVITAHASLACYLKFQDDEDMKKWINSTFYKVVCSVNEKEFSNAKKEEKYVLLTESKFNNQEVAIAFSPREEFPKYFKFLRLWKVKD